MPSLDRSARVQPSAPRSQDPRLLAQPHMLPFMWRLLGLYDQQTRPVAYDSTFDDRGNEPPTNARGSTLVGATRQQRYDIFDEMDGFGLVQSVLDVYAEESTQPDYDKGVTVWIESKSARMVTEGEACLRNCQVEDRLWAVVRRMCKYGDAFQRLLYSTGKGVLGWRHASARDVERVEDKYNRLVGFMQQGQTFRRALHADGHRVSFPWDYLHFRLLGKHEDEGYGTGLCERFFREWRNLTLTEDALLMYRLRRAPDRNMVMIDAGSLEDHDAMRYVNQWRKKLRKHQFIDPASPDYRTHYNPLTPLEDIFIPVRQDSQTRIETLSGSGNVDAVYDLDHAVNAYFGSAAAPKAYFGFEGDINAKATLQQQDVRFARGCKRIRRATIYGLRQLLDVHYTLLGDGFELDNTANAYLVQMSPISYLDEFERLELIQMRYQIVTAMASIADAMKIDARVWASYVLLTFAKLPEDVVLRLIQQTPEKPATGAGPGFAAMGGEAKEQTLDNDGKARAGFFSLNEAERDAISRCVHASPGLRRSIMVFAELHEDETSLRERLYQQTDTSLLPVLVPGGTTLNDAYADDAQTKLLNEDILDLRDPTRLEQRRSKAPTQRDETLRRRVSAIGAALGQSRGRVR